MNLQAGHVLHFPHQGSILGFVIVKLFTESERAYLYYEVLDLKSKL